MTSRDLSPRIDDPGRRSMLLTILLLAAFAVAPVAHAADAERIVVTKARLIGRDRTLGRRPRQPPHRRR